MKTFALIFRLHNSAEFTPSPSQMQKRMQWLANLSSTHKLADRGQTLLPFPASTRMVLANGSVADGPHTCHEEYVSGYMLISVENLEEAVEIAKTNPIHEIGGTVEIREILNRTSSN